MTTEWTSGYNTGVEDERSRVLKILENLMIHLPSANTTGQVKQTYNKIKEGPVK